MIETATHVMATRVHLDGRAVLWRLALIVFAIRQLGVWLVLQRFPMHPARRLAFLLFKNQGAPRSVLYAVVIAGAVTLLIDLLVQLLLRPLLAHWSSPRVDDTAGLFQLAANEWVVASMPGRRKQGRIWRVGTLALTNRRLWYFPDGWDLDTWSCPLEELAAARLRPAPAVWGFLRDWPDRFEVVADGEPAQLFAVADPNEAVSWFHPTPSTEVEVETVEERHARSV